MKLNKKISSPITPWMLLASLVVSGCGFQSYQAKPIDPAQTLSRYRERNAQNPDFKAYLINQGYSSEQLPIKTWSAQELTLSALFFNPALDVGRAQWRAARSAEITAAQRPLPGISTTTENHSDTSSGVSPWTLGLAIDIPLETAGKRQARIDRASSLSEAIRLDIGQTAWQLRNQVNVNWLDYNYSNLQIEILKSELSIRNSIVEMLEKRLEMGMSSSIEVANARLLRQRTQQSLDAEIARKPELLANLAASSGLPTIQLASLDLDMLTYQQVSNLGFTSSMKSIISENAQEQAILNRLDLRAALSRYAAAEAKLRLEIARQYPDIILSPGYSYDQGDKVWSLGISALLTMLNKNRGLIEEAKSLREVEAAQFVALQTNIIANLEKTKERLFASFQELDKAKAYKKSLEQRLQQTQKQFDAGFADRLELENTLLENIVAEQNILVTGLKAQRAIAALEDAMQRPMDESMGLPNYLENKAPAANPLVIR